MAYGSLRVTLSTADEALPLAAREVYLKTDGGAYAVDARHYTHLLLTGDDGSTGSVLLETPDEADSTSEGAAGLPYATVDVFTAVPGYYAVRVKGVKVFAGKESLLTVVQVPANVSYEGDERGLIVYDLPPSGLVTGKKVVEGERGPFAAPQILDEVTVPEVIAVHLGAPDSAAPTVYVPYTDYIKNAASAEIYPTWEEEAIRANVIAINSITLNRIYTEWYRGRGYDFDITNATAFDQSFVPGNGTFENVGRIVDELFNVYVVREGFRNPLFTSYCDGVRTVCDGMSQWGSQALAKEGYTAEEILRYYYGDDIALESTDNIVSSPFSYPGTPLTVGASGAAVRKVRRDLYRIAAAYPSIPRISPVYDVYDAAAEEAVRAFQSIFGLEADGIVGKATWYKLSSVYAAVTRIAELTGGGDPGLAPSEVPDRPVGRGDRGEAVAAAQFMLDYLSVFYDALSPLDADGFFGAQTENAVRAFQAAFGLDETGRLTAVDWETLFRVYYAVLTAVTPALGAEGYPGEVLKRGARGESVYLVQVYLNKVAEDYPSIPVLAADGVYGAQTAEAVTAFQRRFFLNPSGEVDALTWERLMEVYTAVEKRDELP